MENVDHSDWVDKIRFHFRGEPMILLESQMPGHPSSNSSYIAVRPKNWIKAYHNRIEWKCHGEKREFLMNPWSALKLFQEECSGWLFGHFGYDLKNFTEELFSQNRSISDLPDLYFMEPEWLFQIDKRGVKQLLGEDIGDNILSSIPVDVPTTKLQSDLHPLISRGDYIKSVELIKGMIRDGDFYELNYSYPLRGVYGGEPYEVYRRMRDINPVPFAVYMTYDDTAVCCASPERFLQKSGSIVLSQPIKGTSGRSEDPDADLHRIIELQSEKNRAENLMIVDLVRHDLSKIARNGSVHVSRLYEVQSFGTVHQLISTIEAEIREDVHPVDAIKSCFPMGSMTGAPKIEVMKTIENLEVYKRGLYSGAIGYFTPDRDFDFNVVIRTAIIRNKELIYPVGGAITSDSDPVMEWTETEIKSRAILNVFQ